MVLGEQNLDFAEHQYLKEIYTDCNPRIVVEKASQMGISTYALARAIWACDTKGMTVIYFFPTDSDVRDFSQDRFGKLTSQSPALSMLLGRSIGRGKPVDNTGLKQIGQGSLYFRGLYHSRGGDSGRSGSRIKSIDADFIIFDELDEAQPRQKEAACHRVDHSRYRWILEVSTPTIPGYGIDGEFQRSDQRYWLLRCSRCGHSSCVEDEFPSCLARHATGRVILVCIKCGKALDPALGEWVARHPGADRIRGYHISQLYSPRADLGEILEEYEDPMVDRTLFYNHRLGMPYIDSRDRLQVSQVLECCSIDPAGEAQSSCFLGVDQGRRLHAVLGTQAEDGGFKVLRLFELDSFQELDPLMIDYKVRRCVIDALPNQHSALNFAARFPGRVYCCYYSHSMREKLRWASGGEGRVEVNRTASLDGLFEMIRLEMIQLPPVCMKVRQLAEHCHNMARIQYEDPSTGQVSFRYVRTGEDHFAHALNYCNIAGSGDKKVARVAIKVKGARNRWAEIVNKR